MKWIEIEQAKPKFKADYLLMINNGAEVYPVVGHLKETKQTADGFRYLWTTDAGEDGLVEATHIALITLPGKKEVPNA